MVRTRRLARNGNSTVLTVPLCIMRALGWRRGELVALGIEDGRLVGRKLDESELLAKIRLGNAAELADGARKG